VPTERTFIRVTSDSLRVEEALESVADPSAGGTCVFLGTVRDRSAAGEVIDLTYEAWEELANRRLSEISNEALARWDVRRIAVLHRTGRVAVGETTVVIACSAPHRADAFDACRHVIERLKQDVPIWKREALASGDAHWVMGS
jgi:molybdopterin synthase catalytic subunit